jgi:nucleotide-binding universal stress UspA family protein
MILPKVDIKRLLYTTDLSENARYAFAYAVSLANLYGASITLLHVISEVSKSLDKAVVGYISEDRWEEIKRQQVMEAKETLTGKKRDYVPIREVLGQFCEDVKSSHLDQDFVADEILVTRGNPVDEILAQAEERNCDLIVMGTQGHGILEDALIGSTARRVIRRSKKPVLVVRLPEEKD